MMERYLSSPGGVERSNGAAVSKGIIMSRALQLYVVRSVLGVRLFDFHVYDPGPRCDDYDFKSVHALILQDASVHACLTPLEALRI